MKKSPNSANSPNKTSLPAEAPFFQCRQRVRYSETDKMGIAHNKCYFEWFEIGRTEFCRSKGIPYAEIEERGFFLVVVESLCRYKKALQYDEEFTIRIRLREGSSKKIIFDYMIVDSSDRSTIAEGYTVHLVTDRQMKRVSLPDFILDKIRS